MPNESGLTPLAELSRQPLSIGTPPVFVFTTQGRIDRDLVALSLQLRTTQALESIANTLAVHPVGSPTSSQPTQAVTELTVIHDQLQTLYQEECRLIMKDALHGLTREEESRILDLSQAQEDFYPSVAEALGWNWVEMTAPGRLRYARPSQTVVMLQALSDLQGGPQR